MKERFRWLVRRFSGPKGVTAMDQPSNLESAKHDDIAIDDYEMESSFAAEDSGRIDNQGAAENITMPDIYTSKQVATEPTSGTSISSTEEEPALDKDMYQIGYALGNQWARRDANPEQLLHVKKLGDGKDWIEDLREPAKELTDVIDPNKSSFVGTGENPSPSFVAGFIDGAQVLNAD